MCILHTLSHTYETKTNKQDETANLKVEEKNNNSTQSDEIKVNKEERK